jgi:L-iditol 2-dehydrogenase
MLSWLFYGPEDIRLEEIPQPIIGEGEVLVKIKAAVTGGTDSKTYLRGHPRIIKTIPSAFGYEFAGEVTESNAVGFKTGNRVIAANTAPCYECFFCKKEEFQLCENLDFLNGSFAEYIKIPEQIAKHNLYTIPDSLDYKAAVMTQTLAVALQGFIKTEIQTGDVVAIYGLGAIGQCFIKLCKNYIDGVTVVAIGRSEQKLELAEANGADHCLRHCEPERRGNPDLKTRIKELGYTYGADKVIEAVGKVETWQAAMSLVRPGGTVNFFGGAPKGSKIELDSFQLHYQETKIIGSFHHQPKYIKEALDLIASGKIQMSDLISHEMKLEELEKTLEMMIAGEAMKVLITSSLRV